MLMRQVLLLYTVRFIMDDETLLMTMLFDFFGDLLTEKQYEYFDLYHNEDLSLSEIAEKAGISRQGVYDIVTRAEKSLMEFEQKTSVVHRWLNIRADLEQTVKIANELLRSLDDRDRSSGLTRQIIQTLEGINNGV